MIHQLRRNNFHTDEDEMTKFSERVKAFMNPVQDQPQTQARAADTSNEGLKSSFASMMGISESGVVVNEETSLKFSAVWLARRILSELPASLPIEVYEEKGSNRTSIDHEVKELLMKPNALMNHFTYHELMNDWLQGWGNGVAVIDNRRTGRAENLLPVHPSTVTPVVSKCRQRDGDEYQCADEDSSDCYFHIFLIILLFENSI